MRAIREFLQRLRSAFRPKRTDQDLRSELQFHLELEAEAGLRRGLSHQEASRQARLHAGGATNAMENLRDQRGLPWLEGAFTDLRHASRSLLRHRSFSAIAIATLAIAVAMNTLIFTLVNGVVLRPLPYPQPERLVRIFESSKRHPKWPISITDFLEFQRSSRALESIALYTGQDLELMHGERPERLRAVRISDGFFPTLGIQPMIGRNFTGDEMHGLKRVVILGNQLWRTRFNADPDLPGKTIRLNRANWTVVGVLPPGFQHIGGTYRSPLQGETVDLWWPLQLDLPEQAQRNWHFTNAVARMKPGVSLQQADEDLRRLAQDLNQRQVYTNLDTRVSSLTEEVVGDSRQTVWLLVSAGGLVLLIACANVAGLSIARGLARRKEVAVRQALGASTWRLVSAILCENLALGIVGGMVGLGLSAILSPVWHALLPMDFPRVHEVKLTPSAGIFAVACALATSLSAGLVAGLRKTTSDPGSHLTQESRGASAGREAHRLRTFLVASEIAFATVLCSAAALLVHSSLRLSARPQGFEPQGVLTFSLTLPGAAYSKPDQFYRFYEEVAHRWRELPGVHAAAFGSDVPWTGYDENTSFGIPGVEEERRGGPQSRFHYASDGYFESLRIAIHKGRSFDERDRVNSPKVVVVSESLVRRYLPNGNPLGKTLDIFGDRWQIAGVAADVFDRPADLRAEPAFWFPLSQQPLNQVVAVLRTDGDPLALLSGAANAVHEFDRELAVAEVRPMYDIARMSLGERNLANWLFQAFAILALSLAVVGIYGLLSYVVEQRHKEFGIRMALGATRSSIVWLVLKNGLLQAGIGGVAGVLLAPLAERSLASLLYGVTPLDPGPLLFAPTLIVSAALLASLFPAFTAARSEPGSTLRAE